MPRLHAPFALLVVLLTAIGCKADQSVTAVPTLEPQAGSQRSRVIDDDWRFVRSDVSGAADATFDDAKWEHVTLPHTWNVADGSDGGNNYYRGPGWYRRSIAAADADLKAGKRFYLRFGAASLVADVYVNGQHIGQHRGGFAAFCYDVTEQLHAGKNSVAVRVDNSKQDDIAPQSGDFTVFGGLYRDVELLVLNPLHISPIDDASSGVYVHQLSLSDALADVNVVAMIQNDSAVESDALVTVAMAESPDGRPSRIEEMGTYSVSARMRPHSSQRVVVPIPIRSPHRWNGHSDPFLCSFVVTVGQPDLETSDRVVQPYGFRTIALDPARGLLLNGQPYAAHGVNVHQEVGGKGWAGSDADYDRSYALIREMGATCVRMAHYQHNPHEYDVCDRLGLLVWTEEPLVNAFGKSPAFGENLKQQLRELIKQNYNHPSIVCWGLWNEVGARAEDPNWQIVHDCNALAHELDPSRPTVAASNQPPRWGPTTLPDAIAFNRYTGWYGGSADQWPGTLNADRAATQGRAIGYSEYGAGGSAFQHELNPARIDQGGPWHPEEYQCLVHEQAYRAMKGRPDLWGTFIWAMFDFSIDSRHEGDHAGRNDKGMVTFDRQTKKDVFYFYQANWTTQPMVHITSARYEPYPIGTSDVKVYSNCDTVELLKDARSLGTQHGADGVFVFKGVTFTPGTAELIARGTKGDAHAEDRVTHHVSREASTRTTTKPATTRAATTQAAH